MSDEQTVYVAKAGNAIKIGVSKDPEKRVKQLNTGNAKEVELHSRLTQLNPRRTPKEWEKYIHDRLSEYSLSGEWFEIEALERLHEITKFEEGEPELTDRQEHVLGVLKTLGDELSNQLVEYDSYEEKVIDQSPNVKILKSIVAEYNLPHGVCECCERLAYYHRSEDGETCQRCNVTRGNNKTLEEMAGGLDE